MEAERDHPNQRSTLDGTETNGVHPKHGAWDVFCHGPLLDMVQRSGIYKDSKTFVDMYMMEDPDTVLREFHLMLQQGVPTTNKLQSFIVKYFSNPGGEMENYVPHDWTASPRLLEKIKDPQLKIYAKALNDIWKTLGRKMKPLEHPERHSIIEVPYPFLVPGDRFREIYYWDTYWIIGGLLAVDMTQTVRGILQNFLHIVDIYGYIPNGSRIYYLGRSQPPLLIPMVELYHQHTGDDDFLRDNISILEREYNFWIESRSVRVIGPSGTEHHVARYNVQRTSPRPEGYITDIQAVKHMSEADKVRIWSHIASACESGWDFSTRWLGDTTSHTLETIKTRNIIPVDLNVYLCWAEQLLAKFHGILSNDERHGVYSKLASDRKAAIDDLFWNENLGAWFDYELDTKKSRTDFYTSNVFPLFADCTNVRYDKVETAQNIFNYIKKCKVLEKPGGIPTSLEVSGQQWDYPNVWSPLVHLMLASVNKLPLLEARQLSQQVAHRWVMSNMDAWHKHGLMFEKYDCEEFCSPGGGGEYVVQAGFGWTNGVILMLLEQYDHFLPDKNTID